MLIRQVRSRIAFFLGFSRIPMEGNTNSERTPRRIGQIGSKYRDRFFSVRSMAARELWIRNLVD